MILTDQSGELLPLAIRISRMKLNLRDLFWLILVVALAIAWWVDSRSLNQAYMRERADAHLAIAKLTTVVNQLVQKNAQLEEAAAKTRPPSEAAAEESK